MYTGRLVLALILSCCLTSGERANIDKYRQISTNIDKYSYHQIDITDYMVRTNYECPRCGLETPKKTDMAKHFKRVRLCKNVNDIELTEAIKDKVLKDHVYHPPKDPKMVINNTINHFNTINNFIQSIDVDKKMRLLMDQDNYDGVKRLSFEDTLDGEFEYRIDKMACDGYRYPYVLDETRLLDLIDGATRIDRDSLHQLNILFDKTVQKIKVWSGKEWESYAEDKGVIQIVSYVKSYFLNDYELYLIKKLHKDGQRGFNPFDVLEHLRIYYRFLVPFSLKPTILDYTDNEVLGHRLSDSSVHILADKYMSVYREQEASIKQREKRELKTKIAKMIKGNSAHNISELNSVIFDLIKVDEEFRNLVLQDLKMQ